MIHLTRNESILWTELTDRARLGNLDPDAKLTELRPALRPAFRFHAATLIAVAGDTKTSLSWLAAGSLEEKENMACAYMAGFLQRHASFSMPVTVFEDPRPYIHFTTVPAIEGARHKFRDFTSRTMPSYERPVKFMDVGCGNGTMGIELLQSLQEKKIIPEVQEIILVDPFPSMLEIAEKTATEVFPKARITTMLGLSQDISARFPSGIDFTLCSLSIHHMPWEVKAGLVKDIASRSREVLLFEMDADHDTHELGSSELSLSVYQSYGAIIDAIFAHDAPVDIALKCVDLFLLAEVISLLSQPRGKRTEYHMTSYQWRRLFEEETDYRLSAEETCLACSGVDFFGQHFIKDI